MRNLVFLLLTCLLSPMAMGNATDNDKRRSRSPYQEAVVAKASARRKERQAAKASCLLRP